MTGRTLTLIGVMTPDDILAEISRKCEERGAKAALARRSGIPASLISDVLARRRPVNEAMANALGFVVPGFFVPARSSEVGDVGAA